MTAFSNADRWSGVRVVDSNMVHLPFVDCGGPLCGGGRSWWRRLVGTRRGTEWRPRSPPAAYCQRSCLGLRSSLATAMGAQMTNPASQRTIGRTKRMRRSAMRLAFQEKRVGGAGLSGSAVLTPSDSTCGTRTPAYGDIARPDFLRPLCRTVRPSRMCSEGPVGRSKAQRWSDVPTYPRTLERRSERFCRSMAVFEPGHGANQDILPPYSYASPRIMSG